AIVSLSAAVSGIAEKAEEPLTSKPAAPKLQERQDDDDSAGEPGLALISLGAVVHAGLSVKSRLRRLLARPQPTPRQPLPRTEPAFDAVAPVDASFTPAPARRPQLQVPEFEDAAFAPAEPAAVERPAPVVSKIVAPPPP